MYPPLEILDDNDLKKDVNSENLDGLNVNVSADDVVDPNERMNNQNKDTLNINASTDINNQNTKAHIVSTVPILENILNPSKTLNNVIPRETVHFESGHNDIQINSTLIDKLNRIVPIFNKDDFVNTVKNIIKDTLPEVMESMINTNCTQEMNNSPDFNEEHPPPPPLSPCDESYNQLSTDSDLAINQNLGDIINNGDMNNNVTTSPNCSYTPNINIKNNNSNNNSININYPSNNSHRHNNNNHSNNNNTYSNKNNNHPSNSFRGNIKYECNDNKRYYGNSRYPVNSYQRNDQRLYNNQRKKPNIIRAISNQIRCNTIPITFIRTEHYPYPAKVCYLERSNGSRKKLAIFRIDVGSPDPKKPWECVVDKCRDKWHRAPVTHAMKTHIRYDDLIYVCDKDCKRKFKEARLLNKHKCKKVLEKKNFCKKCEKYYKSKHTKCKPLIL